MDDTTLPTQCQHARIARCRLFVLPGMLALLVLLMPVSYRAGADNAHPHSIFQPVIDRIVGHAHHHAHEPHSAERPATTAAVVSFAPPGIPLTALRTETAPPTPTESEVPSLTTATLASDQPMIILALGLAILLHAADVARSRRWWYSLRQPAGVRLAPESPPPQGRTTYRSI